MARCFSILMLLVIFTGHAVAQDANDASSGLEFFEKRIRPLLVKHCYSCHSEKAEKVEGGFLLDTRDGLLKGGDQGDAIVPGEPERSLLIQAVRYEMDDLKMPPDRRLSDEEIADFVHWVKIGTPDPRRSSTAPAARAKFNIAEARQRWPFQPPQPVALPVVKNREWPLGIIDQFLLTKMDDRGLVPVGDAEPATLLRRLTFDLTGLPPTPDEVASFLSDDQPAAWERQVDRLLASPRFGERWGRHWMDVVRYADTAGDNSDYPIPQMYKYRNWIIAALNRDLPYNEFVTQQLAGDLLPSASEEERYAQIIATGYLANARRFGSRVDDYPQHLTIEDTIDNLGRTFLGLTINCARCHDHKFDPLSTEDYYGLYGIFHSTRYPWPGIELEKSQRDFVPLATAELVAAAIKDRVAQETQLLQEVKRLESEKKAAEKAEPADKDRMQQLDKEIKAAKKSRDDFSKTPPPFDTAYAVAEAKRIEGVAVQIKGDPEKLGKPVARHFPDVLGGNTLAETDSTSGRRALAAWLTSSENPLTTRVLVNRLWHHHFGKGLVATPNDFGKQGRLPTHPELLDVLALRFTADDWSMKRLHRQMVLSHAYRQSSQLPTVAAMNQPDVSVIDPNNELRSFFPRRRLDAESLRDAMLSIAGTLDSSAGSPHPFPEPKTWGFTQHNPFRAVYETNRRSVYLMTQRIQRHPYLAIFDGPDTGASTAARTISTTTLQALYLLNDSFVHEQAAQLASRLLQEKPDHQQRFHEAMLLLLGRAPSVTEQEAAQEFIRESLVQLNNTNTPNDQRERLAWESLLRSLFRLNEFVYVE